VSVSQEINFGLILGSLELPPQTIQTIKPLPAEAFLGEGGSNHQTIQTLLHDRL